MTERNEKMDSASKMKRRVICQIMVFGGRHVEGKLGLESVVSTAASVFFLFIRIRGVEVGESNKGPDERHGEL
jgi:hypothetical protein